MSDKRTKELFSRYMMRLSSQAEEAELMNLLVHHVSDEEREALVSDWYDQMPEDYCLSKEDSDRIFNRIVKKKQSVSLHIWRRAAAVAAGLALLIAGYWMVNTNHPEQHLSANHDIPPGKERAVLTLANGSELLLDNVQTGEIAKEKDVSVINQGDELVYQSADTKKKDPEKALQYHTLTTPKGSYYRMTLPDGSRVWLNAASSIRYPVAFADKERRVTLTGEAYFEIAPKQDAATQARIPFIVAIDGQAEVEVLATRFNINGYSDEEKIKTTLLEGSIRFSSSQTGKSVLVSPGEQVAMNNDGSLSVYSADLEEVLAWKQEKFIFEKADIQTIMRQLARWYDVEVEYKGNISYHFGGIISRNVNISKVFDILEHTGNVRFELENNKVIVMPSTENK
jgi:ferric-dicitrate binding protein FerR (iron transport regulator)